MKNTFAVFFPDTFWCNISIAGSFCNFSSRAVNNDKGSVVDWARDPSQESLCHWLVASALGKEVKGGAAL